MWALKPNCLSFNVAALFAGYIANLCISIFIFKMEVMIKLPQINVVKFEIKY